MIVAHRNFYDPTPEQIAKLSGPWSMSFSGGKDSTALAIWVAWLIETGQIKPSRPQLVQSDTEVEDPALNAISHETMGYLTARGWQCAIVDPRIHEKLYNRILGIGNTPVHAGGRKMRWCTRATKIDPMHRWRREHSSGLVLTGVRYGESAIRDEKIKPKAVSCSAGGECGLPPIDGNTYGPIINWSLCNVIDWLNGMVRKEVRDVMAGAFSITQKLVSIYGMRVGQPAFAEFGEPEITASRFGCIGCPAISSEREAPRSVVARYGSDSPLIELYDVWFEARRRDNRCIRNREGKDGRGPIKMEVRKRLFDRVMDIQCRAGVTLITPDDERFIRQCWADKVYPRGWSEADELVTSDEGGMFQ